MIASAFDPSTAQSEGDAFDPQSAQPEEDRPVKLRPLGKVTDYGQKDDPYKDSASLGTGKFKRPTGAWDNALRESSLAVSPDVEAQFKDAGIRPGDPVRLKLADGRTVERTWDDRTMQDREAVNTKHGPLRGRFDFYNPGGAHPLRDAVVVGFESAKAGRDSQQAEFDPSTATAWEGNGKGRLASAGETFMSTVDRGIGTALEGFGNVSQKLLDVERGASAGDVMDQIDALNRSIGNAQRLAGTRYDTPGLRQTLAEMQDRADMLRSTVGTDERLQTWYREPGQAMKKNADELFSPNPAYSGEFLADTVPQVAGSAISSVAPFVAAPPAGVAAMFGQTYQTTLDENRARGVDEETATKRALQNAIVSGGLESIGEGIVAGAAKRLVKHGATSTLGRAAGEVGKAAAGEFVTGAAQEGADQVINEKPLDFGEIVKQGALEALGSLFVAGPAAGIGAIGEKIESRKTIASGAPAFDPSTAAPEEQVRELKDISVSHQLPPEAAGLFDATTAAPESPGPDPVQPVASPTADRLRVADESVAAMAELRRIKQASGPASQTLTPTPAEGSASPAGADPQEATATDSQLQSPGPVPESTSRVRVSAAERAAEEEFRREQAEALRQADEENTTGLGEALQKAGGLPGKRSAHWQEWKGELGQLWEARQGARQNAGSRTAFQNLFRDDAESLDTVAESLREQGFQTETADDVLNLVDEWMRTGREPRAALSFEAQVPAENIPFSKQGAVETTLTPERTAPLEQALRDGFQKAGVTNLPPIRLVDHVDEIPDHLGGRDARNAVASGAVVEAFFDPRKGQRGITIVASGAAQIAEQRGITLEQRVQQLGLHEIVHYHQTIGALLPGSARREYNGIVEGVLGSIGQQEAKQLAELYGFNLDTPRGRAALAEEYLARFNETGSAPGWVQRAWAKIRTLLRQVFPNLQWTPADLRELLDAARRNANDQGRSGATPMFSLNEQPASVRDRAYQDAADRLWKDANAGKVTEAIVPTEDERQRVLDAYRHFADQTQLPTVSIADVMEFAGFKPGEIERARGVLAGMWRNGDIASLPSGDWSLVDNRRRAWGISPNKGDYALLMRVHPDALTFSQQQVEEAAADPQKRRKFIQSVKDSPFLKADIKDRVESLYTPITNKDTVEAAQARINEVGIDRAMADVLATNAKNPPTALTNAIGIELLGRLQAMDRFADAGQIVEHMAEQATTQGQAIQALAMLARLSPEGVQTYAHKQILKAAEKHPEVKKLLEEIKQLRQKLADAKTAQGTKAILQIQDLLNSLKLDPEKLVELNTRLRQALMDSATNPGTARDRIVQLLLTAGMERDKARVLAERAIKAYVKEAQKARDSVLKQMLNVKAPKQKIPAGELEKWRKLNEAGALDDQDLYEKIGKKFGLPIFTRDMAKRIQQLQREYDQAPDGTVKLVKGAQMLDQIHSMLPSDFWSKVRAVQNMSMLLNLKTATRNIVGNAVMWVGNAVADGISAPVDLMVSVVTGQRTHPSMNLAARIEGLKAPVKDFQAGRQHALQQGATPRGAIVEGVKTMIEMARLSSSGKYDVSSIGQSHRHVFSSRVGRLFEDVLTATLGIFDRAFHQSAYLASLEREMRTRGEVSPSEQSVSTAHLDAAKATFQDENFLSKYLGRITRAVNGLTGTERYGLGTIIMPFTQVPGSILLRGAEWSPIGFIRTGYEVFRPVFGEEFRQKEAVDAFTRAALGSGAMALGFMLYRLGVISGAPEDDPDREAMRRATGLGSYRINFSELKRRFMSGNFHSPASQLEAAQQGDVVANYDWLQPSAMPLAMGAQMAQQEAQAKRDMLKGKAPELSSSALLMMNAGFKTLQDQPLLTGLFKFMSDIGTAQRQGQSVAVPIGQAVMGVPGNFIPGSLAGQIGQLLDNTPRETRGGGMFNQELNRMLARVPGMADNFPAKYDLFGEMQERYQYGRNGAFNVLVNPAFVSEVKKNPLAAELERIYQATGNQNAIPSGVKKKITVNGKDLELTNEQISEYQRYTGKLTTMVFGRLIASPNWARLPDEEKARLMAGIIGDVNTAAKQELFSQKPVTVNRNGRLEYDGRAILFRAMGRQAGVQ